MRLLAISSLLLALSAAVPARQQQPPAQPPPAQPAGQPPAGTPPAAQQPPAQQPPAGQRPPVIRSGINFVSVDVIVTDKKSGEVVLDMKPEEFDIREDKKPQKVDTFDIVRIAGGVESSEPPREIRSEFDEEREAKQPNVRLFVMLLDDYHVRRGNDLAVRKPLIDFVTTQLGPQDMVAIMYPLTSVSGLTFTRNRDSLIAAITHFEGRKNIYEPRNEFEERYAYYPAATVEQIRNDVVMGALKGAAVRLGGMRDGRKSIILVSEGFTSNLPAQLNDPVAALPGLGNPNSRLRGIDPATSQRQDSQEFFNQADLQNRMREVFDTANRNNTSIYAVDPRGLAAFEYDISQGVSQNTDRKSLNESLDSLRVLADNTDGRAIVNRNDLASGMKQIMRDASGYYLIGYTSSSAPTDGKFHSIDVRVKRGGVDVRARKGYWAYTAEDAAKATSPPKPGPPPAVATALSAIVEPASAGHAAKFWVGTDRGQNGMTRVTFVWQPLAPAANDRREFPTPARVMLTATGSDGRPVFRGSVPDENAAPAAASGNGGRGTAAATGTEGTTARPTAPATPASAAAPAGASTTFEAPPGQLELRMLVQGPRGQVVDSTARSLTIPDFSKTQVSLSTPRVYRARTAHEMLLIRNNPDAPPTADRDFSRVERLLVKFDAYAADGSTPQVTARLLNRGGQQMADVPIQAVAGKPLQIDFPLASLAAGEYVIEVNAKGASGTAQEMVGFRVGS